MVSFYSQPRPCALASVSNFSQCARYGGSSNTSFGTAGALIKNTTQRSRRATGTSPNPASGGTIYMSAVIMNPLCYRKIIDVPIGADDNKSFRNQLPFVSERWVAFAAVGPLVTITLRLLLIQWLFFASYRRMDSSAMLGSVQQEFSKNNF